MRADKFNNIQIANGASQAKPQRIKFDDRKVISISIINTSRSDQTLWVGVNSDEAIEPIEPGGSKSLAARDAALLRGYVSLRWDDPSNSDTRLGFYTLGVDFGELSDEELENCK